MHTMFLLAAGSQPSRNNLTWYWSVLESRLYVCDLHLQLVKLDSIIYHATSNELRLFKRSIQEMQIASMHLHPAGNHDGRALEGHGDRQHTSVHQRNLVTV